MVGAGLLAAYIRPNLRALTGPQIVAIVPYAIALAAMNVTVYLALDHAPLGVVSAILMLGPLTVAAFGQRSPFDLVWVGLAAIGALILTLSRGVTGSVETIGLAFSVVGAVAFGSYIILGKRVTTRTEGLTGLAVALLISAAVQTPLGVAFGEPGLWALPVLAALVAAGIFSSLIPFAAEMTALRSLSTAKFGLLLALEPAVAAIIGLFVLGQQLSGTQVAGIGLVVVASAGSMGPRGWTRRLSRYNRELMADPKIAALDRVPLFGGLSIRELGSIAEAAEERSAAPGEVLTEQGTEGREFFIITEGAVEIQQDGQAIRTMGPGDFLGEIALVFGGMRTATAVVKESARLLVLSKDEFTKMLKAQPRIEDKILSTIMERMRYR